MQERPNYYAIIPANVRYDKELKANEKLLYGEITSLTNKTGECWATNKYFADLYEVSTRSIQGWISNLEKRGYIKTKIVNLTGRIITLGYEKNFMGVRKNLHGGYEEIFIHNNTSNNNKNNNKKEIKERYFDNEEVNELFNEFLNFRKKLKAVNNDKAITLLVNKLKDYEDETKKKMINQSIENSWKSVFPLKKEYKRKENGFELLERLKREELEKQNAKK